jgi:glycosyltransferase involved in cell wall biosynthesis
MLRSFHEQTYRNKRLLIVANGLAPCLSDFSDRNGHSILDICEFATVAKPGLRSIGELRNEANAFAGTDIIAHWDSDDWSHPNRLAEQVALLTASYPDRPPEAVSYNEMLFWDTSPGQFCGAWLYRSPNPLCPIGTSLAYWRRSWEKQPFANRNIGEDLEWWSRVRGVMASSMRARAWEAPRMIAAIHGGNTVPNPINPESREWKRVPEWDSYCRGVMA